MSNLNDRDGNQAHQGTRTIAESIMLNGRPALIVEEEFLIALDLQRMLEGLGVGQTLFARNMMEARKLRQHWPDLAVAIVEMRADGTDDRQLTAELAAAAVPLVITTGDFGLSRTVTGVIPVIVKPIPEQSLASAIEQALATRF
jgi:CheY-like chemotaxis protein